MFSYELCICIVLSKLYSDISILIMLGKTKGADGRDESPFLWRIEEYSRDIFNIFFKARHVISSRKDRLNRSWEFADRGIKGGDREEERRGGWVDGWVGGGGGYR